jgi:hypothetical protein
VRLVRYEGAAGAALSSSACVADGAV